jgi:hypothetical protein
MLAFRCIERVRSEWELIPLSMRLFGRRLYSDVLHVYTPGAPIPIMYRYIDIDTSELQRQVCYSVWYCLLLIEALTEDIHWAIIAFDWYIFRLEGWVSSPL